MYEDKTPERVAQSILTRLSTDLQTGEGSFLRSIIAAAAAEISECYHSLDAMIPMFYLDAGSGEYIDRQAATVGITRRPGVKASCSITFAGTPGTVIPAEAVYYSSGGLAFVLREAVTLDAQGAGTGILDADETGAAYNLGAGAIVSALRNVTGVTGYTSQTATGGADPETDEALLTRYLARMRRTPTSGNPYHYQLWAEEVAGVGYTRVIAKWDGAGTVKVLLADASGAPVTAQTVTTAQTHIDLQRPVGAAVTVAAATAKNLTIAAAVTVDSTTTKQAVRAALEAAVQAYLRELVGSTWGTNLDAALVNIAQQTYTVLYNRIGWLLLSIPGVTDYTTLTINGASGNVTLAADEVPVLTEVSVT